MTWWQIALCGIGAATAAYACAWLTLGVVAALAADRDPNDWIDDLD